MIGGEAEINPNKAYQKFITQIIELCPKNGIISTHNTYFARYPNWSLLLTKTYL